MTQISEAIIEPPVPDGANTATGEWSGWYDPPGKAFRFLTTNETVIGDHRVIGFVTQEEDGRCGEPKVFLDGEVGDAEGYTPEAARRFAYAILAIVDDITRWSGEQR